MLVYGRNRHNIVRQLSLKKYRRKETWSKSDIKRKKLLRHTTTWKNFTNMMQVKRAKYRKEPIPFVQNVQIRQINRDRK